MTTDFKVKCPHCQQEFSVPTAYKAKEQAVLEAFDGAMTIRQLCEKTGFMYHTVGNIVRRLVRDGKVRVVQMDRMAAAAYYHKCEQNPPSK